MPDVEADVLSKFFDWILAKRQHTDTISGIQIDRKSKAQQISIKHGLCHDDILGHLFVSHFLRDELVSPFTYTVVRIPNRI